MHTQSNADFTAVASEILGQLGAVRKGFYETTINDVPTLRVYANAYGHYLSIEQAEDGSRRIFINSRIASEQSFKKLARAWRTLAGEG